MSSSIQFPSGEWIGFYVHKGYSRRFMMDLILEFNAGRICGEGSDGIGPFAIQGEYHESSLECSWIKTYLGRHSVRYYGYREGKGIWGTWNLVRGKGGFHIWPIGSQPSLDSVEEEEEEALTHEFSKPVAP